MENKQGRQNNQPKVIALAATKAIDTTTPLLIAAAAAAMVLLAGLLG